MSRASEIIEASKFPASRSAHRLLKHPYQAPGNLEAYDRSSKTVIGRALKFLFILFVDRRGSGPPVPRSTSCAPAPNRSAGGSRPVRFNCSACVCIIDLRNQRIEFYPVERRLDSCQTLNFSRAICLGKS